MHWLEVTVQSDNEAAEVVAETLRPFAHGGVVIEQVGGPITTTEDTDGWSPEIPAEARYCVRIYLPGPGEPGGEATAESRVKIEEALYHLNRIYPIAPPEFRLVSDEDWANAWKKHYSIFRLGRRLVIRPAWLEYAPEPGDLVLTLDPGMAFGTGLHPSTQLCLVALEDTLRGGERVLDVGTGSGILAIAAARLGAAEAYGVDNDPVAVDAARGNIALNGVADRVRAEVGSADTLRAERGYDVLVVNILARVIIALLDQGLVEPLAPGGTLIAAGLIEDQADDVARALAAHGVIVRERRQQKDWVALVGMKM
jgi:ribosomal protein L11 methyltransferase